VKLAVLTLDFSPDIGGVQSYLYEICRRLAVSHEVTVITPVQRSMLVDDPFGRVHVSTASVPAFTRALHAVVPDRILVGHAHPRLLLPAALSGWGRYATVAHGNDYLSAQRCWHRALFNKFLAHSTPLITQTEANAERLRALKLPLPIVIHPGTDPDRFMPPTEPLPYPPVLLTVGRLVPRKGIDTTLEAISELSSEFPDLRYRIVGSGPDGPRLGKLVGKLHLASRVEFLGRVASDDLPEVYHSAHIFVMPAREEPARASLEGFGIVYLEASASGLPVIAGRSGGTGEAVRDRETGLLVEPDNPQELAVAIRILLNDPRLRQRMGQAGRCWVEEEMNWDRAAKEMEAALEGS